MEKTNIIKKNASRWNKLPAGNFRLNIHYLFHINDYLFKLLYKYFSIKWRKERGWEHSKYKLLFSNRNVLEIGSGMGFDSLIYSPKAKSYTHGELSSLQIDFLKKVHRVFNSENLQKISFLKIQDPIKFEYPKKFNAFYAHGVLHHVPFDLAKEQFQQIDKYLEKESIVVFLMYPKERWLNAGKPDFEKFGNYTDGGCPWTEYYDREKIMDLVGEKYQLLEEIKWGKNSVEFVNFELVKITK